MTTASTPTAANTSAPYGIAAIALPPGLRPGELADLLAGLPADVSGLAHRRVTTAADGATAVYLAGEDAAQPEYGMVVVLIVPEQDDADAAVAELQRSRWGDPANHTLTSTGPGGGDDPAFREFWRSFPPGLFVIPHQPVYFLLFYRAGTEYAFMVIAGSAAIRAAITAALVTKFRG